MMEYSQVSWHKMNEEGAIVQRNGEVCTEYAEGCHPVITSDGALLFVSPDNKYYYRPDFLHESIRFLIDHDELHPVMRPVSEGLINDFRGAVEEFKCYAEEAPKEWTGVGVAEEILECLEHLAGKLGTSLKQIEEVGKHRRVPLASLMDYRERKALKQEQAMQDLARLGQEFDRG